MIKTNSLKFVVLMFVIVIFITVGYLINLHKPFSENQITSNLANTRQLSDNNTRSSTDNQANQSDESNGTSMGNQNDIIRYFYPISNYNNRINLRGYGKLVKLNDREPLACGVAFSGYHTGDDLEAAENEINQEMPVFAIARGKIVKAEFVKGYGGLIVIESMINDETITVYYGHIKLSSTDFKAGGQVKAGQRIAVLGDACSSETDGERKHLHFAIHQGREIDLYGYVNREADLKNWLNPSLYLAQLKAKNP